MPTYHRPKSVEIKDAKNPDDNMGSFTAVRRLNFQHIRNPVLDFSSMPLVVGLATWRFWDECIKPNMNTRNNLVESIRDKNGDKLIKDRNYYKHIKKLKDIDLIREARNFGNIFGNIGPDCFIVNPNVIVPRAKAVMYQRIYNAS